MSSYLTKILDHIGFNPRPQQVALFEALLETDETGVVGQAGTGTGKSLAVFAAAAHWNARTGLPSLVVVPTNILLKQYIEVDAPKAEEALGITVRSLMGRNRYLCEAAPGFEPPPGTPDWVLDVEVTRNAELYGEDIVTLHPKDAEWFGCPGRDEGCDADTRCHYRLAKAQLDGADIIVTNAHLMVLDDQLRMQPPVEVKPEGGGCEPCVFDSSPADHTCGREPVMWQPCIFPQYGALFIDECHTLEDVLRGFATKSIPLSAADAMGARLADWLRAANGRSRDAYAVEPDGELVKHLRELADWKFDPNEKVKKREKDAVNAAAFMLKRGQDGAYKEREAVLWVSPDSSRGQRSNPKLVSTQINLAGGARRILTKVPFALVSGTVPKSLRGALGIPDAVFVDCGHPFDYGKQGKLKISKLSGAFKAVRSDATNESRRATEVYGAIAETGGGTLALFSSYKDMENVYHATRARLCGLGLDLRMQDREGDNQELGRWFKDHGNAVLFGTESFATGFDAPGDALRQVIVWKLPYPGLDPVTRAIMARSRQRYEDMMRMKVTQAVGRLIRTTEDTGTVFIVDSRAENLIGDDDPMLAHLSDFKRIDQPRRVRAWDIE